MKKERQARPLRRPREAGKPRRAPAEGTHRHLQGRTHGRYRHMLEGNQQRRRLCARRSKHKGYYLAAAATAAPMSSSILTARCTACRASSRASQTRRTCRDALPDTRPTSCPTLKPRGLGPKRNENETAEGPGQGTFRSRKAPRTRSSCISSSAATISITCAST